MTSDPAGGLNNISVNINLNLGLSDFNKSVTITLPPAAQNAPQVSPDDFSFF